MKEVMTRKIFWLFFSIFLLTGPFLSIATADSPLVQGLAGAGHSGIERDPLFSNPASAALISQSFGFFNYTKPSVPSFHSGGREFTVGMADGGSTYGKGVVGYTRTAMARSVAGSQVFVDRSEIASAFGGQIFTNILSGVNVRYVTVNVGQAKTKFFQGDVGVLFPLFQDMRAGISYDNALKRAGERPATFASGAQYQIGYGIKLFGDLSQIADGVRKGKKSWAYAAEFSLAGDFVARAGRYYDAYLQKRGWSMGLSWMGPRASFDYAMRVTKEKSSEKDHLFGMTVAL